MGTPTQSPAKSGYLLRAGGWHLIVLLIALVALLAIGAGTAQASPAGDDDTAFGTQGTAFSRVDDPAGRPMTDQAPDGTSVSAVEDEPDNEELRLVRLDSGGNPTGFGGDGEADIDTDSYGRVEGLLDLRALSDGSVVVLARGANEDTLTFVFDAEGDLTAHHDYSPPSACDGDASAGVDAARVRADGGVYALWDCSGQTSGHDTILAGYAPSAGAEGPNLQLPYEYGEDVEIGPDGRPYTLGNPYSDRDKSHVYRARSDLSQLDDPTGGGQDIKGDPVDLAVDNTGRPVVWTTNPDDGDNAYGEVSHNWEITRLNNADLTIDPSWGNDGTGTKELTDPRQGQVYGGSAIAHRDDTFVDIRPGDKVLVTGPNDDGDGDLIAGLTNQGQVDTGWSDNGFKDFSFAGAGSEGGDQFDRIGEPSLQSDGKILVPSTTEPYYVIRAAAAQARTTAPPDDNAQRLGVTRLNPDPVSAGSQSASSQVSFSAVPANCGRRAISLVRADLKGKKVELTGLVGSRLYGKKVSIQTNYGAKSSGFTKVGSVKASSKTGTFTATVARPSAKQFTAARFRAMSGPAKSPELKLAQSLTSRSVKSAKGEITVKGHVNASVLGKRHKVVIRRLACGRYRTVGSAKPDASGNYSITFKTSAIRGVSFYRAEDIVQVRPGSKKYAIQYARAIAIHTTSQTG